MYNQLVCQIQSVLVTVFWKINIHVTLSLLLQSFPDRFVQREILNLTVTCLHKDGGCEWHGSLRAAEVSTVAAFIF